MFTEIKKQKDIINTSTRGTYIVDSCNYVIIVGYIT